MATVKQNIEQILPLITELYPTIVKGRVIADQLGNLKGDYIGALIGSGATSNEAELREKALTTLFKEKSFIDPFNCLEIFERIIWPAMNAFTVGMKDDPRSQSNSACGGVLFSACFNGSGNFGDGIKNIFNNSGIFHVPWLDGGTNIARKFKELQNLWKAIEGATVSVNERKEIFNLLFTNESMVKLYVIINIGLNPSYYTPFSIIAVDPYLAYLAFFMIHVGGGNSFDEYAGVNDIYRKAGGGAGGGFFSLFASSWADYVGTDSAKRAALATASTEVLAAIAKWLQGQKQTNQSYYTYWNSLFITDKKCLINMLVIINETVNLQGQTNTFTYQPTAATYQNALGLAYKNFEITVAD